MGVITYRFILSEKPLNIQYYMELNRYINNILNTFTFKIKVLKKSLIIFINKKVFCLNFCNKNKLKYIL